MNEILQNAELISALNYVNWSLGFALLLLYTWVFQVAFKRYALVVSNRDLFASNFYYYGISIFLIITTIKSSLALSLGLVGALSIIRFRTAIKEPEQIIYLLGLTAIAISLAAEQFIISTFCVAIYVIVAFTRSKRSQQYSSFATDYLMIQLAEADASAVQGFMKHMEAQDWTASLLNYEQQQSQGVRLLYKLRHANPESIAEVNAQLKAHSLTAHSVKLSASNA